MKLNSLLSVQLYTYTDRYGYYEKLYDYRDQKRTRIIDRKTQDDRSFYIAWLTYRKIQTVWKAKLSLCYRGKRAWTSSLSFRQYVRNKTYYDLCAFSIQRSSRESFIKLQSNATNYGRNKQYQSRVIGATRILLNNTVRRYYMEFSMESPSVILINTNQAAIFVANMLQGYLKITRQKEIDTKRLNHDK